MVHSLDKDHLVYTSNKKIFDELINYLKSNGYTSLSTRQLNPTNQQHYSVWIYPRDKEFNLYNYISDYINKKSDNVGLIEEIYLNALRSKKLERIINEEGL